MPKKERKEQPKALKSSLTTEERETKLINPFPIHTSLEPSESTPKAWTPRRWSENTVSKTDQTAEKNDVGTAVGKLGRLL
jgi:hypothetical protein